MLLVQHTGNECPSCPELMNVMKRIGDDESYASRYHHVASHSYNSSDDAFSLAAQTLSKNMDIHRYPMLTYNLTAKQGYYEDEIKESILSLSKDVAEVGICASSAVKDGRVIARIAIKSAIDSKYRVAVWLLEDNVPSPQTGATASWHNMHSNCLRLMYGKEKTEGIYGSSVGFVAAGDTEDMIVTMDLDQKWVVENCKLLVIASVADDTVNLENCVYCPVQGSVAYNYL